MKLYSRSNTSLLPRVCLPSVVCIYIGIYNETWSISIPPAGHLHVFVSGKRGEIRGGGEEIYTLERRDASRLQNKDASHRRPGADVQLASPSPRDAQGRAATLFTR